MFEKLKRALTGPPKQNRTNLRLVPCQTLHFMQLMAWFKTDEQVFAWTGNNLQLPFETQEFLRVVSASHLHSFALMDRQMGCSEQTMVAFGQVMPVGNKVHLARLCVHPEHRGKGLGVSLVKAISRWATSFYQVNIISLFVYPDNTPAYQLYQKMGFRQTQYHEQLPHPKSCYMQATIDKLLAVKRSHLN